jgi:glycosyltransferase involved in cell wall biosynthesis
MFLKKFLKQIERNNLMSQDLIHAMPPDLWDILVNSKMEKDEDTRKLREYFSAPTTIDPTKKTIVFSTPSRTGTSFFRLELPMYALKRNHPDEFNIIYADGNLNPNHIKLADLIIFHRAGHIHDYFHKVFKFWPKTEKRPVIIHDVDDNEFNLPNSHPMKTMWLSAKKDQMSIKSISESDFVTTTGKKLRQTFSNYNKGTNVKVFRNMFDWKMPQWYLKRDEKYNGKIVIGWVGLTSHFEDLRKMVPILKYIHDKFPNTHFILAGMALKDTSVEIRKRPDGTDEMIETEVKDEKQTYRFRVKELYKEFNPERIEFYDAVGLEEYGKFYKDLDIGLAFVEKNTFNACKSEIKAVEYMKYGAVPIYSRWGGYADMYENVMDPKLQLETKEFAIETENPSTWQQTLEKVLLNFDEYKNKANELQKWVEHIYEINRHIDDRVEF